MEIRTLKREEINDIQDMDRSEIIKQFYYYKNR